jgi:hypothetical protein
MERMSGGMEGWRKPCTGGWMEVDGCRKDERIDGGMDG